MDSAGRIVIPKSLRMDIGFVPGEVEIEIDGAGIRITPVGAIEDVARLKRVRGRLVVPSGGDGQSVNAADLRDLRLADQR
jgi:bifunctional DNA-binding transcriptional regulator/antitoxin component of YhaV-PrlF toxin-antitoxin module